MGSEMCIRDSHCTQNYVERTLKGKDIEPLLSNSREIQNEHMAASQHEAR